MTHLSWDSDYVNFNAKRKSFLQAITTPAGRPSDPSYVQEIYKYDLQNDCKI